MKWFDTEETKSGKNATDEGCADGEQDGESEDGQVDGDGLRAGDSELGVSGELMYGEEGECDAKDASGDGEEEDFGECALQDAGGGGSEGRADGGFAVATDEAGKLGVGEVDAGDEQDAENGSHEEPETGGGFADDDFFHRLDVGGDRSFRGPFGLIGWDLVGDVVVDGVEVIGGLCDGDAGFQATECDVIAVVAVPTEVSGGVDCQGGDDLVVW